jgi:hypothetical protein
LDEPKSNTAFFFFCWGGWRVLSIDSGCSLLKESSPDDTPTRNIPCCFLGAAAFEDLLAAAMSAVGIDDGTLSSGTDRKEELTCEGEKPLTTLVVLLTELPLAADSELAGCAERSEAESEVKDLLSAIAGVGGVIVVVISAAWWIWVWRGAR